MTDPEREVVVPPDVQAGVWANGVEIFGDVEDVTLESNRVMRHSASLSLA